MQATYFAKNGAVPEAYRIKRHLLKAVHGIDILEIGSWGCMYG